VSAGSATTAGAQVLVEHETQQQPQNHFVDDDQAGSVPHAQADGDQRGLAVQPSPDLQVSLEQRPTQE